VPARWVTVRRHHKLVKVKRPARCTIKKVIECHPRPKVGRVAVRMRVRRHGKEVWITRHKRERVVLPPHLENSTKLRVKHVKTALVTRVARELCRSRSLVNPSRSLPPRTTGSGNSRYRPQPGDGAEDARRRGTRLSLMPQSRPRSLTLAA
jgi:hypothetical protein